MVPATRVSARAGLSWRAGGSLSVMPWPSRPTSTAPVVELRRTEGCSRRRVAGLDRLAVGGGDLGARRDVQARLDHAVVAERDAQPGIGAQQTALADRTTSLPPPDNVPHDRRAAADVGAVVDHHTGRDAASTIEVPSVPALKFTKPSCITVVPAARCAPSRTWSASAIRTPAGTT